MGGRRPDQVDGIIGAAELRLSEDELDRMRPSSLEPLGFVAYLICYLETGYSYAAYVGEKRRGGAMFSVALLQSKVQVNDTWLDYFIIACTSCSCWHRVRAQDKCRPLRTLPLRKVAAELDHGSSLPWWNLGALEIWGWPQGAAEYGIMQSHYYWIGAIPAMVFVALFMIPFYYASRVPPSLAS